MAVLKWPQQEIMLSAEIKIVDVSDNYYHSDNATKVPGMHEACLKLEHLRKFTCAAHPPLPQAASGCDDADYDPILYCNESPQPFKNMLLFCIRFSLTSTKHNTAVICRQHQR